MSIEFVNSSVVELIKSNANDEDVARAAWVSNFGFDARLKNSGKIAGLIKFLYRERHLSPFEHGSMTFFVDTHLAVAREFMRHRTFSYNETSARYKEMEPRFYIPGHERPIVQDPNSKIGAYKFVAAEPATIVNVQNVLVMNSEDAWNNYQEVKRMGAANEVARLALPMNTMTQFYATANPRNVLQFLMLRNELQALYEIRDVAEQIEAQFAAAMPMTYAAYIEQKETQDVLKRVLDKYGIDRLRKEFLDEHVSV